MSSASPLETWQAGINPQFVQQLQERQARSQVIDPNLGQGLWSRSQFFHDRLSFFHQVAGQYLQADELSVESLPIVYAQPRAFTEELSSQPSQQARSRQQPLPIAQPIQPSSRQQKPAFVIQAKMAAHTPSAPPPVMGASTTPSIGTPNILPISHSLREDTQSELNFAQRSKNSEQGNPAVHNRQTAIDSSSSPPDHLTHSLPHSSPVQTVPPIVVSPSTKAIPQRHHRRSLDVSAIESSLPLVRPARLLNQSKALEHRVLAEVQRATSAVETHPVAHSPTAHSPIAHSPIAHSPIAHSPISSPVSAQPIQPPTPSAPLTLERLTQPILIYPKAMKAQASESQRPQSNPANPLPLVFASTRSEPSASTPAKSATYEHPQATFLTSNNTPASSAAAIAPAVTPPNPIQNPPSIDLDAVAAKVERKLMRQMVIERERRG